MAATKLYAKTISEARCLYKSKTGHEYTDRHNQITNVSIFKLKKGYGKTENRKYYVGSWIEYINRY
jgi:hypothetical protein